mgnify:CR=1 FL=1|jgi:SAM-dependent methyltransferase
MSVAAPANAAQAAAWDGPEGGVWAANADYFDRSVRGYHEVLMTAAGIGPDERVLDVGCGSGQTTLDAARLARAGRATGIDLSASMVAVGARRAADAGLANVEMVVGDAQVHPFPSAGYSSVISRFGSMFFDDQTAAFRNLRRACADGGRLTMVSWRTVADNEWFRVIAGALAPVGEHPQPPSDRPSPFRHGDAAEVREILADAGFCEVDVAALDAPMVVGATVEEGVARFGELFAWLLDMHGPHGREAALARLADVLAAYRGTNGEVEIGSAAWLIAARAG